MKRKALINLKEWFCENKRKPLILRGPRQVGKTTLVRDFAKIEKLTLHEINLERYQNLREIIAHSQVDNFIKEVQMICSKGAVNGPESILFIDEIQAIPEALQFLRYLYEDYPNLPVIAAGSLLEFALQDKTNAFSMPVGRVSYQFMGPCTFNEYLEEVEDDDELIDYLSSYQIGSTFSAQIHERLMARLRSYLIIGGMPEALQSFVDTENYAFSQKILTSIVLTYHDDFLKYSRKTSLHNLQKILDHTPLNIGKEVSYEEIDKHEEIADLRSAIEMLDMAGILNLAYGTNAIKPSLCSGVDERKFKSYFLDCGVLNALSRISAQPSEIRIFNEKISCEQFIAQHLKYLGPYYQPPELFYPLIEELEEGKEKEIDFLFQYGNHIIPIIIEAENKNVVRSFYNYITRTNENLAVHFHLNLPSLQEVEIPSIDKKEDNKKISLLSLPIYLIGELERLIKESDLLIETSLPNAWPSDGDSPNQY